MLSTVLSKALEIGVVPLRHNASFSFQGFVSYARQNYGADKHKDEAECNIKPSPVGEGGFCEAKDG